MELYDGICDICNSENLILDSKDSEKYNKLIFAHFLNELSDFVEYEENFKLCPKCVNHITLLDSKKDYFSHKEEDENIGSTDKCIFCMEKANIISIHDREFLNEYKQWFSLKNSVVLCVSCFYLIEIRKTLKNNLMLKLSHKNDSKHKPVTKQKKVIARRKSTVQTKINGQQELSRDTENILENASLEVKSTLVQNKKRKRKRNSADSVQDNGNGQVYSSVELSNFNLSNIVKLSPLCISNFYIAEDLKNDKKIFEYVPFVKINHLNKTSIQNKHCNYVCLVPQKPMIRRRKTPPIKIKSIKNVISSKEKRRGIEKKIEKKYSAEEISRNKLVVVVERIKLSSLKNDISVCDSEKVEEFQTEMVTPKKKKHVHFNDTPTIIISEGTNSCDYEDKTVDSRKEQLPCSIMVREQEIGVVEDGEFVDDQSDIEESMVLTIDPDSDNELNNITTNLDTKLDCNEESELKLDDCHEEISVSQEIDQKEKENIEDLKKTSTCEVSDITEKDVENSEEKDVENPEEKDVEKLEEKDVKNSEEIDVENSEEKDVENLEEKDVEKSEEKDVENSKEKDVENSEEKDNNIEKKDSEVEKSEDANDKSEVNATKDISITCEKSTNQIEEESDIHGRCEGKVVNLNFEKDSLDDFDPESIDKICTKVDDATEDCIDSKTGNCSSESDSLDGFEVIDQDILSTSENTTNGSEGETEKKADEIESLLEKYCEDEGESSRNNSVKINVDLQKEISDIKNTTSQKIDKEGISKSLDKEEEDFDSLIDEVQECLLTVSNNSDDESSLKTTEASLIEILEHSFDESSNDQESENNLKRKHSDDNEDSNKKPKMDV